MPRKSPNRAELIASHNCLAIILPLNHFSLSFSPPLFCGRISLLDETLKAISSLTRRLTFRLRLYTQLSPPHPRQSLGGCPCKPNAGFTLPGGHLLRDKGEILLFWGEDKTICMHTIAHRLGGKGTGRKA